MQLPVGYATITYMKVLIIDDTELIRRMYARNLELAGFEVTTADDGSKALDSAINESPDVILMDVMMPIMNGIDAIKVLKANEQVKNIPVIILTSYEDDHLLAQFTKSGAARFIIKSNVEFSDVIEIINQVHTAAKS